MEFPIENSSDFWNEVAAPAAHKFRAENSSLPLGLAATIFLFHLFEKHYGEKFLKGNSTNASRFSSLTEDNFELARKVANSSKHLKINIQTLRQGGFSSAFSDDFARPLNIIDGDRRKSLDQLVSALYTHWENELGATTK